MHFLIFARSGSLYLFYTWSTSIGLYEICPKITFGHRYISILIFSLLQLLLTKASTTFVGTKQREHQLLLMFYTSSLFMLMEVRDKERRLWIKCYLFSVVEHFFLLRYQLLGKFGYYLDDDFSREISSLQFGIERWQDR